MFDKPKDGSVSQKDTEPFPVLNRRDSPCGCPRFTFFLFELLRRKHEKMLAKHTDKRKACPYDAYRISIFFAAVGFSCRTLLGRAWKPAPTGLCRFLSVQTAEITACRARACSRRAFGFAGARIHQTRPPFSLTRTFPLTGESPALRVCAQYSPSILNFCI